MGSLIAFTCDACGYAAQVAGGKDRGMVAVVETMTCGDCRGLVDVLIGEFGHEASTDDQERDEDLGVCPSCRSSQVVPWSKSRPCPRCGSSMTKGERVASWD